MNWREYFCKLLGCTDELCNDALLACLNQNDEYEETIWNLKDKIRQLELLIPPQYPPPDVDLIAQKDASWVQNVIDNMGLGIIRLGLDQTYYLTNEANFLNIVAWDWIDTVKYQVDVFDCENFAISFKAQVDEIFNLNQVGIVIDYKSGHAYNLVIYPDGVVHVLEPQNDGLVLWTERNTILHSLQGAIVLI